MNVEVVVRSIHNAQEAERVHELANALVENAGKCEIGMRAARARDPHLLRVLEGMAEQVDKIAEAQLGQSRRSVGAYHTHKAEATEVQLWRVALTTAVAGEPNPSLAAFYAAGCVWAGLTPRPYCY